MADLNALENIIYLGGNGVAAQPLYITGPISPELAEIIAPKIVDVAPEDDRRAGVNQKSFREFGDGMGVLFADQGDGFWESDGVWTVDGNRIVPAPSVEAVSETTATDLRWNIFTPPQSGHRSIGSFIDPANGLEHIFFFRGSRLARVSSSLSPTAVFSPVYTVHANGSTILEFSEHDSTTNNRLYAFVRKTPVLGESTYFRSDNDDYLNGWAVDSTKQVQDAIVLDRYLIGALNRGRIIYSLDGVNWNDDDVNDGDPLVDLGSGHIVFVGLARAPWSSDAAVYFLWNGQLRVLNFDERRSFEVPLPNQKGLVRACIFEGQVAVTDGFSIWLYDPDTQRAQRIGLPEQFGGAPPTMRGSITSLFPLGQHLGAGVNEFFTSTTGTHRIWIWNKRGWHPTWPGGHDIDTTGDPNWFLHAAAVGHTTDFLSAVVPYLVTISSSHVKSTLPNTTGSEKMRVQFNRLPRRGSTMLNGVDRSFKYNPVWNTLHANVKAPTVDTSWFRVYGDLPGVATQLVVRVDIPQQQASVDVAAIKIYYRTKREFVFQKDTTFTLLGTIQGSSADLTGPYVILPFGTTDLQGLYSGLQFREIQFRVEFLTGNGSTNEVRWPELYGFTLIYAKVSTRKRYTFTVDVNRTISQNSDDTFQNFLEVWTHINNCIVNPLASLEIPGYYYSRGVLTAVKGVKENMQRDALAGGPFTPGRSEFAGLGQIQLVFEDVAPLDSDLFQLADVPS